MRYRDVNDLADISRDATVVMDFIGQDEYRSSLDAIGISLNVKGFVTPFDDAMFSLELDLLNLERLRARSSGMFKTLLEGCHRGVDFLIGLGQTIPTLSAEAKTRLLWRLRKGLKEGLWPLYHELRTAASLSKHGWDIYFHDFEEDGGYDFLATDNGQKVEVEAKPMSAFTGWAVKPENIGKLFVEVKQHFLWEDESTIPLIGLKLLSSLSPNRERLEELIAAFNEVARTRGELSLSNAHVLFIGAVPNLTTDQLKIAILNHSRMARKTVFGNLLHPRLVSEIDSERPSQLGKKLIGDDRWNGKRAT